MYSEIGNYGLSVAAGTLSTLSPCVLPLVPILVGSTLMTHRLGPHALATGLALSFTVVGVLIIGLGAAIGLDQNVFHDVAAVLLIMLGMLSRQAMMKFRDRLIKAGNTGKKALGGLLLAMGMLIVTGIDKNLEALILQISPEWLIQLTTAI